MTVKGANAGGKAGSDVLAGKVVSVDQDSGDLCFGEGVFPLLRAGVLLWEDAKTVMQQWGYMLLDMLDLDPFDLRVDVRPAVEENRAAAACESDPAI